jgi:hypothetical protein
MVLLVFSGSSLIGTVAVDPKRLGSLHGGHLQCEEVDEFTKLTVR